MVHARVSREGETREEREGRGGRQRREAKAGRREEHEGGGMAFEFVLSILAFFAVAALLGILVYQVNNNPIPFPSLSFLFFYSRWKFFFVQMFVFFLLLERVPPERGGFKLSRKALVSSVFGWGGGGKKEGGKVWAWV